MKYFFLSIIGSILMACNPSPPHDGIEEDFQNHFNAEPGDSIPLNEALEFYDSLLLDKNTSTIKTSLELNVTLDSLKKELLSDRANISLKMEIQELETHLEEVKMIETVGEGLDRRDAEINAIIERSDSL
ncbi:MAG: hypothetical protein GQ574_18075 [Crocinitomix sp.]|nr:hypothetical protein [Crocinitomix sp.]